MEQFSTFDRAGRALGLVARREVHKRGLWHKSAQVFLFNSHGQLLVQKRSTSKDLYAGLWDYSVGEHLLPEESFRQGALRGLGEELGVYDGKLKAIGELRWVRLESPGSQDCEIQQAFRCAYDGEIVFNTAEVSAIKFVDLAELDVRLAAKSNLFTPWLAEDIRLFRSLFPR